jgi:sugar phosphate permease
MISKPDSATDGSVAAIAIARRRLVPLLTLVYVIAWLDRVNIGFAALQMNRDLGFSPVVYGLGAGLFFVSYAALEIPSNLVLARVGARIWIARIMISWGIVTVATLPPGFRGRNADACWPSSLWQCLLLRSPVGPSLVCYSI